MTPVISSKPAHIQPHPAAQTLSHSARSMGIYLLAGRGSGKSRMQGRVIAWQDYIAGIPQVIIDPLGTTIDNFLDKVLWFLRYVPVSQHAQFWQRIRYIDMSGKEGSVVPFPLYYRLGTERSLREIAERYLQVILKSNPSLLQAQVQGWPPLHYIGVHTGMVLASLGCQITEALNLLRNPEQWHSRFAEAESRYPEVAPAVSFFRDEYIPLREADRARLTNPFMDKIFPFTLDSHLLAMFGTNTPGINWQEVEEAGQTVLLDYRHEQDTELRRFKLLWAFSYLYEHIKLRGRRQRPLALIIDEFAALTQKVFAGENPLAAELDEFINQYMRNHNIWLTVAHQELHQIDEQLRNTLLSLGTYILGSTSSMESARVLADALFFRDPYWVKHYRRVYGRVLPHKPLEVIAEEPQFMTLIEQREIFAQRIKKLGLFQFLLRPTLSEGHIGSSVIPLSIHTVDRDKETGEYLFPDQELVTRVRSLLASSSGIPIAALLKEQAARLSAASLSRAQEHGAESPGAKLAPPQTVRPVQRRERVA